MLVLVLGVLVLVLLFFLCRFNSSQERLGIIHCNFADMFSILLLNDSQSLNTFEILVWDIFAFFASEFVDLAVKQALIGEISNENQITQTYYRWETIVMKNRPLFTFIIKDFPIFYILVLFFNFKLVILRT